MTLRDIAKDSLAAAKTAAIAGGKAGAVSGAYRGAALFQATGNPGFIPQTVALDAARGAAIAGVSTGAAVAGPKIADYANRVVTDKANALVNGIQVKSYLRQGKKVRGYIRRASQIAKIIQDMQ